MTTKIRSNVTEVMFLSVDYNVDVDDNYILVHFSLDPQIFHRIMMSCSLPSSCPTPPCATSDSVQPLEVIRIQGAGVSRTSRKVFFAHCTKHTLHTLTGVSRTLCKIYFAHRSKYTLYKYFDNTPCTLLQGSREQCAKYTLRIVQILYNTHLG